MVGDQEKIERIAGAADTQNLVVHPRWRDRLDYFLVAAVLALVTGLVVLGTVALQASHKADQDRRDLGTVSAALGAANQRIKALGGTPVRTPAVPPPATVPDSQILGQVANYFSAHPVPTPSIDYSTLRDYVVSYLARHPAPRGQKGAGPTDAQLSDAVSAYFQAHPPQPGAPGPAGAPGAAGPSGAAGSSGAAGRGIVQVDCSTSGGDPLFNKTFTFQITFTDGTVQTVECTTATGSPPT